jgi:acetyl esterase/lipase
MTSSESKRALEARSKAAQHHPQVQRETQRSLILKSLQAGIKVFNSQLIKPASNPESSGSAKLAIPRHVRSHYNVAERVIGEINTYDITQRRPTESRPPKIISHILYFAGGGWQSPPSSHHFRFLARLVGALSPDTIMTVVSYPLAPQNKAPKTFPLLTDFLKKVLIEGKSKGDKVIVAGDSAGGNLAIALTLDLLSTEPETPAPAVVFLICPAVDLEHENPVLINMEKNDPILRLRLIKDLGKAYAGDWDVGSDPRVSPIHAKNFNALKEQGVAVYGMTGSYDILTSDAMIFRDRLLDEGVSGRWLEWDGCMHCWVLMAGYGDICHEVKGAFHWIVGAFKEIENQTMNESKAKLV